MRQTRGPRNERGQLASLFLERTLSGSERRAMSERLVRWYVEELNGVGDRLRFHAKTSPPPAARSAAEEVRKRCQSLLQALRWNERMVREMVWKIAVEPLEMPEDAFAPGVILFALGADRSRLARWISALGQESKEALRAWDPEIERLGST